jgi:lipopolysaccharide export system protein LptA
MKASGILMLMCASVLAAETNQTPARSGLEISADFGRFHLKESTAFYSNNVVVVDPPSKPDGPATVIHCRELTAIRSSTGRADRIIALGSVQIDQGDNHALANRAVYYGSNETMVLTGGFDEMHKRPVLYSSQFTNYGDMIVYDRAADTLSIQTVRTEIPGSALKSSTNSNTNKARAPKLQKPPPK